MSFLDKYYRQSGECIKLIDNGDGTYSEFSQDTISKAISIIDTDIKAIHAGNFFHVPGIVVTLSASQTYSIAVATNGNNIHYTCGVVNTSADKTLIKLYEESTFTSGTTESLINNNRQSSSTSTVLVKSAVSINTYGTLINSIFIGGGTGLAHEASGGQSSGVNKFILKQNTNYSIEITNNSADSNTIAITPIFCESEV